LRGPLTCVGAMTRRSSLGRRSLPRADDLHHLVSNTRGCRDLLDAETSGEESADLVSPLTLSTLTTLGDSAQCLEIVRHCRKGDRKVGTGVAILGAVVDLFAEKEQFFYEVTYGWPGMPTQTKLVDLGGVVTVGKQIKVDGFWWVVEQVGPAVGGHRQDGSGRRRRRASRPCSFPRPSGVTRRRRPPPIVRSVRGVGRLAPQCGWRGGDLQG
jgi:hypothetical protein